MRGQLTFFIQNRENRRPQLRPEHPGLARARAVPDKAASTGPQWACPVCGARWSRTPRPLSTWAGWDPGLQGGVFSRGSPLGHPGHAAPSCPRAPRVPAPPLEEEESGPGLCGWFISAPQKEPQGKVEAPGPPPQSPHTPALWSLWKDLALTTFPGPFLFSGYTVGDMLGTWSGEGRPAAEELRPGEYPQLSAGSLGRNQPAQRVQAQAAPGPSFLCWTWGQCSLILGLSRWRASFPPRSARVS